MVPEILANIWLSSSKYTISETQILPYHMKAIVKNTISVVIKVAHVVNIKLGFMD